VEEFVVEKLKEPPKKNEEQTPGQQWQGFGESKNSKA